MLKLLLLSFTLSSLAESQQQHTSFIDNPPSFYQRGRQGEYSKHSNFYQWWYFNLRHNNNDNNFQPSLIIYNNLYILDIPFIYDSFIDSLL